MIWLTWRQARAQILSIAAMVAVFAIATALFSVDSLKGDPDNFLARLALKEINPVLYVLGTVTCIGAPPIIGAFWGAPLVARELETGTFRLAWNQGLSRTRWLAVKLGCLVLTAALLTGLLSFALTWWAGPIDEAIGQGGSSGVFGVARIYPWIFSSRGVVPAAYAVVGVTVGALIGLLVRRTVAALALTLVFMAALQVVMPVLVREHLIPPATTTVAITADNLRGMMIAGDPGQPAAGRVLQLSVNQTPPSDWELVNRTVNRAGEVQSTLPAWVADCGDDPAQAQLPGQSERRQACFTRMAAEGYQQEVRTQPGSRFWALQWRESALLLALAATATALCFWRIRR
jgi:hypothetical protein